jgi:hypothetical protein
LWGGWRAPFFSAPAAPLWVSAVWLSRAVDARQFGNIDPLFDALLSLVGWWLLVTGATKLLLVLRGFPAAPWENEPPAAPHGNAPFVKPDDAAKGLKK